MKRATIDVVRDRWKVMFNMDDGRKDRSYATLTSAQRWCDDNGYEVTLGPTAEAVIRVHSI